jgi:hypothetical protein
LCFAACKRNETKTAQTKTIKPQPSNRCHKPQNPPGQATSKWPADYPVTGDSVAVITVSIVGQVQAK